SRQGRWASRRLDLRAGRAARWRQPGSITVSLCARIASTACRSATSRSITSYGIWCTRFWRTIAAGWRPRADQKRLRQYVDEFRDSTKAQTLINGIQNLVEQIAICRGRPLQIMEVCGGHTHTIFRYGIQTMLPQQIELIHGPGCPVCVLPMGRV